MFISWKTDGSAGAVDTVRNWLEEGSNFTDYITWANANGRTDYKYEIVDGQWVSLVNPGSMTDDNGDAHVMFSAWEDFIGYTVTVYCGYTDECGVHYLDSIKIKVVDEE